MQLELDIPERLIRKLKALNILQGVGSAEAIELLVISLMENSIDLRIKSFLQPDAQGYEPDTRVYARAAPVHTYKQKPHAPFEDTSTIADGLGDEDGDMPPPETNAEALVPRGIVGMSDKDLDTDLDVADPDHEAAADAPDFAHDANPDHVFSQIIGIDPPADDSDEPDHRILKRKKKIKVKAKVRPMIEDYETSSF